MIFEGDDLDVGVALGLRIGDLVDEPALGRVDPADGLAAAGAGSRTGWGHQPWTWGAISLQTAPPAPW